MFCYFRNRFDTGVRDVPVLAVDPPGSRDRRRHSYKRHNTALHLSQAQRPCRKTESQ